MLDIKFNPFNWKPLPTKKKFLGYGRIYNFSWILDFIKEMDKEYLTVENLESCLPSGITFYDTLDKSTVFTHLGETIEDVDEYFKQRRKFIEYIVKNEKI